MCFFPEWSPAKVKGAVIGLFWIPCNFHDQAAGLCYQTGREGNLDEQIKNHNIEAD